MSAITNPLPLSLSIPKPLRKESNAPPWGNQSTAPIPTTKKISQTKNKIQHKKHIQSTPAPHHEEPSPPPEENKNTNLPSNYPPTLIPLSKILLSPTEVPK